MLNHCYYTIVHFIIIIIINGSMESVTASPVDPLIVKTICEQLDVINKLLVKVMVVLVIMMMMFMIIMMFIKIPPPSPQLI